MKNSAKKIVAFSTRDSGGAVARTSMASELLLGPIQNPPVLSLQLTMQSHPELAGIFTAISQGDAASFNDALAQIAESQRRENLSQTVSILKNNQMESTTALHLATEVGNLGVIKALLNIGLDVNARIIDTHQGDGAQRMNQTPLHTAARAGRVDVMMFLIEKGADVQCEGGIFNITPLYEAVLGGYPVAVNCLIKHGANVEKGFNNRTPLHEAARSGSKNCIGVLLAAGADILARDTHGKTAWDSIKKTILNEDDLQACVANYVIGQITTRGIYKTTDISECLSRINHERKMHEILRKTDINGRPVLYHLMRKLPINDTAAITECLTECLSGEEDFNVSDSGGNTLLHWVISAKREDILEALLEMPRISKLPPLLLQMNAAGQTPLQLAISSGYSESVWQVLEHISSGSERRNDRPKFFPDLRSHDASKLECKQLWIKSLNLLHTAFACLDREMITQLIGMGASPNDLDQHSRAAIVGLCEAPASEIVHQKELIEPLLESGAIAFDFSKEESRQVLILTCQTTGNVQLEEIVKNCFRKQKSILADMLLGVEDKIRALNEGYSRIRSELFGQPGATPIAIATSPFWQHFIRTIPERGLWPYLVKLKSENTQTKNYVHAYGQHFIESVIHKGGNPQIPAQQIGDGKRSGFNRLLTINEWSAVDKAVVNRAIQTAQTMTTVVRPFTKEESEFNKNEEFERCFLLYFINGAYSSMMAIQTQQYEVVLEQSTLDVVADGAKTVLKGSGANVAIAAGSQFGIPSLYSQNIVHGMSDFLGFCQSMYSNYRRAEKAKEAERFYRLFQHITIDELVVMLQIAARRITQCYQYQVDKIMPEHIPKFAEICVKRIVSYMVLHHDELHIQNDTAFDWIKRHIGNVLMGEDRGAHPKILRSFDSIFLGALREARIDDGRDDLRYDVRISGAHAEQSQWNLYDMFQHVAVLTPDQTLYSNRFSPTYGFVFGTAEEATRKGLGIIQRNIQEVGIRIPKNMPTEEAIMLACERKSMIQNRVDTSKFSDPQATFVRRFLENFFKKVYPAFQALDQGLVRVPSTQFEQVTNQLIVFAEKQEGAGCVAVGLKGLQHLYSYFKEKQQQHKIDRFIELFNHMDIDELVFTVKHIAEHIAFLYEDVINNVKHISDFDTLANVAVGRIAEYITRDDATTKLRLDTFQERFVRKMKNIFMSSGIPPLPTFSRDMIAIFVDGLCDGNSDYGLKGRHFSIAIKRSSQAFMVGQLFVNCAILAEEDGKTYVSKQALMQLGFKRGSILEVQKKGYVLDDAMRCQLVEPLIFSYGKPNQFVRKSRVNRDDRAELARRLFTSIQGEEALEIMQLYRQDITDGQINLANANPQDLRRLATDYYRRQNHDIAALFFHQFRASFTPEDYVNFAHNTLCQAMSAKQKCQFESVIEYSKLAKERYELAWNHNTATQDVKNAQLFDITISQSDSLIKLDRIREGLDQIIDAYNFDSEKAHRHLVSALGSSPLHQAVRYKHIPSVEKLIRQSPSLLSQLDTFGKSPLAVAVTDGLFEMTKYLIEQGADLNWQPPAHGLSLMHLALQNGNVEVIRLLKTKGVSIETTASLDRQHVLFYALKSKELMLELVPYPHPLYLQRDDFGNTLLHRACKENPDLVSELLQFREFRENINVQNMRGYTPLHDSVIHDITRISTATLLRNGADPTIKDADGMTPFERAVYETRFEHADLLLTHYNQSARNAVEPILPEAHPDYMLNFVKIGRPEAIDYLFKNGWSSRYREGNKNLLHVAASGKSDNVYQNYRKPDYIGTITLLLSHPISVLEKSDEWTPLHFAAISQNTDVFNAVFRESQSLWQRNPDFQKSIMRVLATHGSPEVDPHWGWALIEQHIFTSLLNQDKINWLVERYEVKGTQTTLLHEVTRCGLWYCLEPMLQIGDNVNFDLRKRCIDGNGNTLLHIAASVGNNAVIRWLLHQDKEKNTIITLHTIENAARKKPFDLAKPEHREIVKSIENYFEIGSKCVVQ